MGEAREGFAVGVVGMREQRQRPVDPQIAHDYHRHAVSSSAISQRLRAVID